jgi:mRNA (2'-O-methyladenosine-N6-)-methyltransferase
MNEKQANETENGRQANEASHLETTQKANATFEQLQNRCHSMQTIPQADEPSTGRRQYTLRTCTLLAKNKVMEASKESSQASDANSESSYEMTKRRKGISKASSKARRLKSEKKKVKGGQKHSRRQQKSSMSIDSESESEEVLNGEPTFHDLVVLNKLPNRQKDLTELQMHLSQKLAKYRKQFFEEEHQHKSLKSEVPDLAIPISADVTKFNFDFLAQKQLSLTSQLFDVIMMDPPWQLSTSQPSRGVAIAYQSLSDEIISDIPIPKLQTSGLLFIWVINVKYSITCKLMEKWGYTVVDEIAWIKKTVTGKIAKGHGFYLQHAKETCLVGVKVG